MPFFEWSQNNSGGSFVVDDKLTHKVIIEGDSFEEAEDKALEMGIYYDGVDEGWDCECCGDRWHRPWDEMDFPKNVGGEMLDLEEYIQWSVNNFGWESPDARIFYKDGTVKEFFQQKESK